MQVAARIEKTGGAKIVSGITSQYLIVGQLEFRLDSAKGMRG
jgi:hypothetical protein